MPTPRRLPDLVDALAVIGLAMIWYGLAEIYAPLAPLVVGVLVLALAVRMALRRA